MIMRSLVAALAAASVVLPVLADPPAFDRQRLFTTTEQREQLDAMRDRIGTDAELDEGEDPSAAAGGSARQPEPQREIGVRGFVSRSGGPPALWLDGGEGPDATDRGRIEGREVVITLDDGRTVRLKPGQVYDPERGEVIDAFRR